MSTRKLSLCVGASLAHPTLRFLAIAVTLVISVAAAFAPVSARADMIQEVVTDTYATTYNAKSNGNQMDFQGFNALAPQGSILTSFDVYFKGVITGTVYAYDPNNICPCSVGFTVDTFLSMVGSSASVSTNYYTDITTAGGSQTWNDNLNLTGSLSQNYFNLNYVLNPWVAHPIAQQSIPKHECNPKEGGAACGIHSSAQMTAYVTYYYSPPSTVPEPNTLWLMGTGLVGLLGVSRRSRRGKADI